MKASTIAFHRALIRHIKGMLTAWESWLSTQESEGIER